jgi:hypothetical protein
VAGALKGATTALLRLLVNGAQVQQAPMLTIVPGAAASVAWINSSTLASGLNVIAGEEGYAELACLDAFGNRLSSVAVGISAELKHESGQVRTTHACVRARPPCTALADNGVCPRASLRFHLQAPPVSCRIAPMQDGIVRACFRPEKAGPYSLVVKLDPGVAMASGRPATLTQTVTCVAGPMDISKSRIERADAAVVAGRTATLTISCCDIFGNPTCNVPIIPLTLVRPCSIMHPPHASAHAHPWLPTLAARLRTLPSPCGGAPVATAHVRAPRHHACHIGVPSNGPALSNGAMHACRCRAASCECGGTGRRRAAC